MTHDEIEQLFVPDCNIGIVTGAVSRIIGVDCDSEDMAREFVGQHTRTPMVSKTAKGYHLIYAHPGVPVPNRARIKKLPLDIRGDGGYIVAPPSIHETGAVYKALGDWTRKNLPVFDPAWIAEPTSKRSIEKAGDTEAAWSYVAKITATEGHRDNTAYRVACVLIREPPDGFALSHTQALPLILRWGAECCTPEFSDPNVLSRKLSEAVRVGGSHRDRIKLLVQKEIDMVSIKTYKKARCVICGKETDCLEVEFTDQTIRGNVCMKDFKLQLDIRKEESNGATHARPADTQ